MGKTPQRKSSTAVRAETTIAPPKSTGPTPGRSPLRLVSLGLLIVVGLATLTAASVEAGIVYQQWQSPLVMTIARSIGLPVAIVDGRWVPYHVYQNNIETLLRTYDQPEVLQANGLTSKPTRAQIEPIVLDRLVKDLITEREAIARGGRVSDAVVDQEMQKLIDQTGSAEDVTSSIERLYGWDLATFRQRVVLPFLYRQQLQESIALDDEINAPIAKRMDEILAQLTAKPDDFETIAKEQNEDVTKSTGGDLGIFARGERNQAIEDAAFGLEVGKTSQIIRTDQGFHIVRLTQRIPADPEAGLDERVQAAHIFLAAKQIDAWLFERLASHSVTVLLNGYGWDGENGRVTSGS